MASGLAAACTDSLLRCGCLAGPNGDVERRPYHRYCGCALHKSRGSGNSSPVAAACSHSQSLSYPMRKSWSESSLTLMAASAASPNSSPSSSPAIQAFGSQSRFVSCNFESKDRDK